MNGSGEADLNLICQLSTAVLPPLVQPRLVYLLVEISGGKGAQSLPGNLAFIIDVSDSMRIRMVTDEQFRELVKNGQAVEKMTDGVPAYQISSASLELLSRFPRRIDFLAQALQSAADNLRPADIFSLVAFAGRAYSMIPAAPGRERGRLRQAAGELDYLHLGDGTQIAQGLEEGFKQLQKGLAMAGGASPASYASRMILLTDGHTRNVNECYEWAERARQEGIKLTTMGIGTDFNEDLLIPLADRTGGNAYYIETPQKIPEAFRQELGAALRVSYRNVEIKLQFPRGVEMRHVYRVLPELGNFDPGENMGGSYSLQLGDYDPAAPQALLIELVVDPRPEGSYRIGQAMAVWDDPSGGLARRNVRQDILIQVAQVATAPLNEHVMNIVERVGAYKMGTQALAAAQQAVSESATAEDRKNATLRLREAATRLLDMGESGLASAMLLQADNLEQSGTVDPNATKRLRYETRRMTQRGEDLPEERPPGA